MKHSAQFAADSVRDCCRIALEHLGNDDAASEVVAVALATELGRVVAAGRLDLEITLQTVRESHEQGLNDLTILEAVR